MYQHPDQFLFIAKRRLHGCANPAAIHRRAAEAAIKAERQANWEKRRFRWRYLTRSLLFRLAPGIARRLVL